MASDAKHNIFISEKRGGIGIQSITREYVGALLRDIEVYTTNENTLPAHALEARIEEATKQKLWNLKNRSKIPSGTEVLNRILKFPISEKKTLVFQYTFDNLDAEIITYDHTHTMEQAILTTCAYGFMLRDLNHEFVSRFADELLLNDRNAKAIGSPYIDNRASMNAIIGEGNHLLKSTLW
jgi:hypothetical protein